MEDVVVDTVATADVATADFIATDDAANAKIAAGGANIAVGNDYMTDIGYIGGDVMNPYKKCKYKHNNIMGYNRCMYCNWYSFRNYTWKKKCNEIKYEKGL